MERDVKEVERYYRTLQQVEKWVEGHQKVTETRIRKIHCGGYFSHPLKILASGSARSDETL